MESFAEAEGHPPFCVCLSSWWPATISGGSKGAFGSQFSRSMGEKQNQLDQRGNTFWGPIELVRKPYSVVDSSSTDFFRHFH
jgi:hypothetical protein